MRYSRKVKKNKSMIQKGKKLPKIGDIKKKTKFAFFPIRITNTDRVWLERYIKVYEYGERKAQQILSIADYGKCSPLINREKTYAYNTWLEKKNEYYGK